MKLKKIYESIIGEDYPVNWDVQEFASLKSFSQRQKYCDQNLTKMISGSGRIVYKIDNEKVLKLAKNSKGVAQCNTEIQLGQDSYFDNLFAKVYESDDNGLWVEMQLASKLSTSKFKSIMGYSFKDYCTMLSKFYYENVKPSRYGPSYSLEDESAADIIQEDQFYNEMCELMQSMDMPVGDLVRANSYGIVKDEGSDKVVLVDFGLTQDVYDSEYAR